MSQIIQIVGSIVIGSILLLSILNFSTSVMEKTNEQLLEAINQNDVYTASDLLNYDFRKLGLHAGTSNIILSYSNKSIQFLADVDDDQNAETITYTFSNELNNSTLNPNDHYLYRRVNNQPPKNIASGVVDFNLIYYDQNNQLPANSGAIRTIEIQLTMESLIPFKVNNEDVFHKNYWQTKISPPNLIYR